MFAPCFEQEKGKGGKGKNEMERMRMQVYKNKESLMNGWIHQALLVEGGGYLLSHFRSTIGVAGFNFSVRNGKRWSPRAITTFVFLPLSCVMHRRA